MNKTKAIDLLAKEDIKNILQEIKKHNFKIKYWDNKHEDEQCKWFINEDHIYDFLSYWMDLNLHWTKLWIPLTEELKKNKQNYEVIK